MICHSRQMYDAMNDEYITGMMRRLDPDVDDNDQRRSKTGRRAATS